MRKFLKVAIQAGSQNPASVGMSVSQRLLIQSPSSSGAHQGRKMLSTIL